MFDTPEELLDQIRLGEDTVLEFKRTDIAGDTLKGPKRDAIADVLAAFANTIGGVFVFGVDDKTHDVIGVPVEKLDLVEQVIREVAKDAVKPPVRYFLRRQTLAAGGGAERAVIRVDVPKGSTIHESPGGHVIREGASLTALHGQELIRLIQDRGYAGVVRFDEQVVSTAAMTDLDADLIDRFATDRTSDERPVFARKLGMAKEDDGGTLRPTVAGLLLGCRDARAWFPNAGVQATAYRSTLAQGVKIGQGYQLDHREIFGPLDVQVEEACRFIARNMRIEASKRIGRLDVPQFELSAVLEAMVNAVAHRDYSIAGSKIRLRLFDDGLEIMSPGGLPNSLDIETIAYRQANRNDAITSLLARIPVPNIEGLRSTRKTLMDKRGEGVGVILSESQALSKKRPKYELIGKFEVKLTIYAATALDYDAGGGFGS